MQRCCVSLEIREMQIKMTNVYTSHPARLADFWKKVKQKEVHSMLVGESTVYKDVGEKLAFSPQVGCAPPPAASYPHLRDACSRAARELQDFS